MRDPRRALVLAVILLGHAVAIYLLSVRVDRPQPRQEAELLSLPIRLMPLPQPRPSTASRREGPDPLVIGPRRAVDEDAPPDPAERSTAITLPPAEGESQDQINWIDQMETRAGGFGDPAPGPMEFGLDTDPPQPEKPAPLNFFRSNSPRRAGYVEMLEPGVERRWVSSRCYRDFGKPALIIPGTRPDLNPMTCLVGDGPVRDDLFDHLKPDYLQDEED